MNSPPKSPPTTLHRYPLRATPARVAHQVAQEDIANNPPRQRQRRQPNTAPRRQRRQNIEITNDRSPTPTSRRTRTPLDSTTSSETEHDDASLQLQITQNTEQQVAVQIATTAFTQTFQNPYRITGEGTASILQIPPLSEPTAIPDCHRPSHIQFPITPTQSSPSTRALPAPTSRRQPEIRPIEDRNAPAEHLETSAIPESARNLEQYAYRASVSESTERSTQLLPPTQLTICQRKLKERCQQTTHSRPRLLLLHQLQEASARDTNLPHCRSHGQSARKHTHWHRRQQRDPRQHRRKRETVVRRPKHSFLVNIVWAPTSIRLRLTLNDVGDQCCCEHSRRQFVHFHYTLKPFVVAGLMQTHNTRYEQFQRPWHHLY